MESQDIRAMHSRLDRLEAKNRLLVCALLALLGLCALAFGCAASSSPVQEVVRAKAFVVMDTEGKVKAGLTALTDGTPKLALYDVSGKTRAELATLPDGSPRLVLRGASGKLRAALTALTDGSPRLALFDASGNVLFSAP